MSISKILIANRGEIALRIGRAAEKLGKTTVFICSEADKDSLFARKAKNIVCIGPAPASESYLNIQKIVETAKENGCDAVHPGYGFLSENAEFAQAVADAGLTFIGPEAESIRILGSKTEARQIAERIKLPLPPGTQGGLTDQELMEVADSIGYPLMIKAAGGGGGRGMRVVEDTSQLEENLRLARSEAKKFFGDDNIFLERRILQPRHVEVQVFGDHYGDAVHFGTRDCSTQRRHQKLVEEAPAPDLSDDLRERIHTAAVNLAKEVGYRNAGTVEFLVSREEFFFLEMNTRIQVEHPVSEEISGVDLVALQIQIAEGEPLPFPQRHIEFQGHSIEYRIYAEDPENDFRPSLGTLTEVSEPTYPYLRIDGGYEAGDTVTPYYDAMLSKVIVNGATREEAILRSQEVLRDLVISGVVTNIEFHQWLLERTPYAEAPVTISFLEEEYTQNTLKQYRNSKRIDPQHRAATDGIEYTEQFRFRDEVTNQRLLIELVHLKDGTFLAAPVDLDGHYAREEYCRRSNGYETALSTLREEVLSKIPAAELFG